MALIDIDKGAGMHHGTAIKEARAEIAAITGSARSSYDLKKDRERDEQALRDMVDRRMTLEEF